MKKSPVELHAPTPRTLPVIKVILPHHTEVVAERIFGGSVSFDLRQK